jgi:hypothetical protein
MENIMYAIIDPIIRATEEDLRKLALNFAVGDRVRVKETGHRGKITDIDQFSRVHVLVDSGHSVRCSESELERFDFPANETGATGEDRNEKMQRIHASAAAANALVDPIVRSGDVLQKGARSKFRIGQAAKVQGREGTIIDVTPGGLIEIRYSPSFSALCVASDVQAT